MSRRLKSQKNRGRKQVSTIARINGVDIDHSTHVGKWLLNYELLRTFKVDNDGRDPPRGYVVHALPEWNLTKAEIKLGSWCDKQRQRKSKLSAERIRQLDSIGFEWSPGAGPKPLDDQWLFMYQRLCAFHVISGGEDPPVSFEEPALAEWNQSKDVIKLGRWCHWQRHCKKKGKLSAERIRQLDSIGFEWSPGSQDALDDQWLFMYQRLCAFHALNGGEDPPVSFEEPALAEWNYSKDVIKLGRWCDWQRECKKKGKLSAERIRKLDDIGFKWNIYKRHRTCADTSDDSTADIRDHHQSNPSRTRTTAKRKRRRIRRTAPKYPATSIRASSSSSSSCSSQSGGLVVDEPTVPDFASRLQKHVLETRSRHYVDTDGSHVFVLSNGVVFRESGTEPVLTKHVPKIPSRIRVPEGGFID